MEHLYKGSELRIKPQGFVEGGQVTFYTVNPKFGTILTATDDEGYITLSWPHLQYMGRGVLQYKVNNPSTGLDRLITTEYYIDSDLEVEDTETLGNVSDRIESTVSGKLTEKIDAGIEKVTRSAQEKLGTVDSALEDVNTKVTEKLGTVDSRLTEIQEDLTTKCPYVGGDYYVYNYDRTTGSQKKTNLYVKGQDGRNGVDGRSKEVRHTNPTETTVTIRSGEFHVWEEVENLNITLQPAPNSPFLDEYGFSFKTGSTVPRISLPSNIKLPRTFIILPNHIYTVTILGTVLEFGSQSL
ncbi:Uncharacterised protein [Prevotella melaninogenica]|uniref:hypothetical protein n=1 Tax=Prevotella melaninogenica TaxID=28132 RepID=UPI0019564FF5|nr:hypothetical protein [Prevotella melaninogenica]VTY04794.1 Uncharacterised protein [Prevotella melaninogenica]